MSRTRRIAGSTTALAFALTLATTAHAQDGSSAPDAYAGHRGFMAGAGLGLSAGTCLLCLAPPEISAGFDIHIGGFVNPRLALMYDVAAWIGYMQTTLLVVPAHTAAVQYWLKPALWIKGGIGLTHLRRQYDGVPELDIGVALTAAVGYEFLSQPNFAFDVSGRINALLYDRDPIATLNVLVGVHWK